MAVDCSGLERGRLEWWGFPDIVGTGVQRSSVDHVADFGQKCSPLFLGVGLVLASGVKCLSD